jgi:hypothetical protein
LIKTIFIFIAKNGKIGCHNGRNPEQEELKLTIFMMFGKYTTKALQEISAERTDKVVVLINNLQQVIGIS